MKNFVNVKTCFLATLLLGAQCASASDVISAEARGTCTMTNVRADKVIYDGRCIIDQAVEQNGTTTWFISLGDAEPMQFVGRGSDYNYGPEKAQFKDYGDTGIFSWSDFTLKVKED